MDPFDLLHTSDKDLKLLYDTELKRVGAVSLDSILQEIDRRKSGKLATQMNIMTIIVIILTLVQIYGTFFISK
jgi:sensor histidine kinase regulating citrate/malate metabolism